MSANQSGSGIRQMARPDCYLCGRRGRSLYRDLGDRLHSVPGSWTLRRCDARECGLAWIDPVTRAEDVPRLYPNGYYTHCPETPGQPSERSGAADRGGGAGTFGKRWLDVGCGNGSFLHQMRSLGWQVTGVEIDDIAVRHAESRFGLKVHHGTLEDIALPHAAFDVISFRHVVEHLPDPVRTLRHGSDLLRAGGRLLLVTPNIDGLGCRVFGRDWVNWDPPRHQYLFSSRSIRRLASESGLEIERLSTDGRSAPWVWCVSRSIRRHGRCTDASNPRRRPLDRIAGRLARWVEQAAPSRLNSGEELICVLKKANRQRMPANPPHCQTPPLS